MLHHSTGGGTVASGASFTPTRVTVRSKWLHATADDAPIVGPAPAALPNPLPMPREPLNTSRTLQPLPDGAPAAASCFQSPQTSHQRLVALVIWSIIAVVAGVGASVARTTLLKTGLGMYFPMFSSTIVSECGAIILLGIVFAIGTSIACASA